MARVSESGRGWAVQLAPSRSARSQLVPLGVSGDMAGPKGKDTRRPTVGSRFGQEVPRPQLPSQLSAAALNAGSGAQHWVPRALGRGGPGMPLLTPEGQEEEPEARTLD